jgi:hypothetical protein
MTSPKTIRSHYDRLERIAEDVKRLGYVVASGILKARQCLKRPRAAPATLGEILATELVEEEIGLRSPRASPPLQGRPQHGHAR